MSIQQKLDEIYELHMQLIAENDTLRAKVDRQAQQLRTDEQCIKRLKKLCNRMGGQAVHYNKKSKRLRAELKEKVGK